MNTNRVAKYLLLILSLSISMIGCSQKLTDAEYLAKAKQEYKEKKIDAAIIELKNALQLNSSNLEARQLLGTIYAHLGLGAEAEKELRRAIVLGASDMAVSESLAKAMFIQNKYKQAREYFNSHATNIKNTAVWNIIQTRISIAFGDVDEAKKYFQRLTEADKNTLFGQYAATYLMMAEDKPNAAEKILKTIVKKSPDEIEAWLLMGSLAIKKNDMITAETDFTSALKKYPSHNNSIYTFSARRGLFFAQLGQEKYDQALKTSNELLAIAKTNPMANYLRGLLAFRQKDYETALTYLNEVYSRIPDHIQTQLLLGSIHYIRKEYEQANSFLSSVVSKEPGNIEARKLLAATRLRLHKSSEAMETLKPIAKNKDDAQLMSMIAAAAIQSGNLKVGEKYLKKAQEANPNDASLNTELAKLYIQKGEYDEAIKTLEKIQGGSKTKSEILQVVAYLKKRDFVNARKKALEIHKMLNNALSFTILGGVERLAGDKSKAIEFFKKAVAKDNSYLPALINLGQVEYHLGHRAEAKKYLLSALKLDEKNVSALMGLAAISDDEGKKDEALQFVEEARSASQTSILPRIVLSRYYAATGSNKKALEVSKEAYEINQDNIPVAILYAELCVRNNDIDTGLRTLETLKTRRPNNALVAFNLAKLYFAKKDISQARDELMRAISINSNYHNARLLLANVEMKAGNHSAAINQAKYLQEHYPQNEAGFLLEGDIYFVMHKLSKAESLYRKALKVKSTPSVYERIARLYFSEKQNDKAIAELKNGVSKFPKNTKILFILASSLQESKHLKEALDIYEKILTIQPNNILALNNASIVYSAKGDNRALAYAKKAHQIVPNNPLITDTLGWEYVRLGKYDEGVPLLETASKNTNVPSVKYHYAYALHKSGNNERAKYILENILKDGKKFPEQDQAKDLLKKLDI